MKGCELMTLLSEQSIPLEEAADALALPEDALLQRVFGSVEWSDEELGRLKALLCLDDEEMKYLFCG